MGLSRCGARCTNGIGCRGRDCCAGERGGLYTGAVDAGWLDVHPAASGSDAFALRATGRRPAAASGARRASPREHRRTISWYSSSRPARSSARSTCSGPTSTLRERRHARSNPAVISSTTLGTTSGSASVPDRRHVYVADNDNKSCASPVHHHHSIWRHFAEALGKTELHG